MLQTIQLVSFSSKAIGSQGTKLNEQVPVHGIYPLPCRLPVHTQLISPTGQRRFLLGLEDSTCDGPATLSRVLK